MTTILSRLRFAQARSSIPFFLLPPFSVVVCLGSTGLAREPRNLIHWPASACPILQLLSLPIRRLSWGCSKDTGRTSSTPVTVVVASCFLHLHITRLSSCHPIPWTGTWIRRNHTTPRARCRLHTALLHLCPPQISADGPRQTPVTAVAHAGYARLSVPETLEMDHAATVPGWSSAVASPSRLVLPRKSESQGQHPHTAIPKLVR